MQKPRRRFLHTLCWILILGLGMTFWTAAPAAAAEPRQSSEPAEPIAVVTKSIEPFVFLKEGEVPSGFSIDLWNAVSIEIGLPYEFTIVESVGDQIEAMQTASADAAIAAISITEERERELDFTLPYFQSGLGILTLVGSQTPFLDALRTAFSPALLRLLAFVLVMVLVAAHLVWLAERKQNPDFPQDYVHGLWESIWWTVVTMVTVGYGDKTPRSFLGRVLGIFWMFAALFIIANFTAGVTTQLTLSELRSTINGPQDLPGKTIAAVGDSTAAEWLRGQGLSYQAVESIEDAYRLLETGDVQAVVYDFPVLRYYALNSGNPALEVAGPPFNKEDYGIAVPTGSPLREPINQALLRLQENGTYDKIYTKWFGQQ